MTNGITDTGTKIQAWWAKVPDELKPSTLGLLQEVLKQSEEEIGKWILEITRPGHNQAGYAIAYVWLTNAALLAEGEAITAGTVAVNAANADRIAKFDAAIQQVLNALFTFGLAALGKFLPFLALG